MMMLNSRAYQNPSTWNPLSRFDASIIMEALMTSRNSPKVIIVTGIVNRISKGFNMVLSNPISKAVARAVRNESSETPGNKYDVTITAMVDTNILSGNRIKAGVFFNFQGY